MYRKDEYLKSSFVQGLRDSVKTLIAAHGIRNSHLTSIAPTGTISLLAENVSSGIEPVFAHAGTRRVQMPDGIKNFDVTDYGVSHFGVRGKLAESVTASEHVAVLTAAQRHVDSSVAKTCNVAPDMSWKDFKELYMQAWLNGAKGCTTFPTDGGKRGSIMTVKKTDEPTSCAAGGCS